MRSKSPLVLMEQLVMVLVFALAAAVCLNAFAVADRVSRRSEAVDWAVVECQNAAEILKATGLPVEQAQEALVEQMGGSWTNGQVQICYDEERNVLPGFTEDCFYVLEMYGLPTQVDGLAKAGIRVGATRYIGANKSGNLLFSMDVAWQEVSGNG